MSLRNTTGEPLLVRTNSVLDATLLVDIFDESGEIVSIPAKRFTTGDRQTFDETTIPPGSRKEWSVRVADRVREGSRAWGKTMSNVVVSVIYSLPQRGGAAAHQPLVCTQAESGVLLPKGR